MTAFEALLPAAVRLTNRRTFQLKTPTSSKLGATERPVRQRASRAWSANISLKERLGGRPPVAVQAQGLPRAKKPGGAPADSDRPLATADGRRALSEGAQEAPSTVEGTSRHDDLPAVRWERQHLGHGGGTRLADLVGILDQHGHVDVRAGKPDQPDQDRKYAEAIGFTTETAAAEADRSEL
eukprot:3846559-Alexandrium_andersonii.AAC.1